MRHSNKPCLIILIIFVLFSAISYFYVVITGEYNGDFMNFKSKLPEIKLFCNFLNSITPFIILFCLYSYYNNHSLKYRIVVDVYTLGIFVLFLVIFQIIVTALFGVGRAGKEIYEAPTGITIFIKIFNRFDPSFGFILYLVLSKKQKAFQLVLLFLMFTLSILRLNFGFLAFYGLFSLIYFNTKIFIFIKKHFLFFVLMIILFPTIVGIMYNIRQGLRSSTKISNVVNIKEINATGIIFGRLIGRLSSYSNSAVIMERKNTITRLSMDFTPVQYLKEALIPIYG
ncbi:MAG: oligosaccharide repeat unit polymerase, partial [Bacteroidales bacterium]|nr:oligosaccharide repeat unit polymerase [Bacteroidales bacterium]